MSKQILKKTFVGFIALTVFLWPLNPILSSPIEINDNVLLKKLQAERLGQSQNFANKNNAKKVSTDNFQEKRDVKKEQKLNYVEGEVLVKFKERKINLEQSSGRTKAKQFAVSKNLDKKEDIRKSNISVLKIKDAKTVEEKIAELKNDPDVEYVEPNYIQPWTSTTPNDTNFSELWGLHDIDAPEAWDVFTGSDSVVVAVLDTGVAYNHPDLINNMWDGTVCKNENNQTISCPNHGWDYTSPDNDPIDDNGHGTHVAGTIGAQGNNSIGVTGVNWNVKLMALKVGNYAGAITGDVVKAIDFAINNNVKIINASFAGSESTAQYDAINRFRQAGGIFIAASGNGEEYGDSNLGDDHENEMHKYPCDYDLDNIICVAATNQNDELADFSDYGADSVDVGAPGVEIYSTMAGSIIFSEDFESVAEGYNIGQFTSGGITTNWWGAGNNCCSKVIYTDYFVKKYAPTYSYESNANTWLISNPINFSSSNIKGATLSFDIWCDTPSAPNIWQDYIQTTYYNGVWNNGKKYDEDKIKLEGGNILFDSNYIGYHKEYTEDISNYLSNDFKFSFDWTTDSSVDYNLGCTIDNIKIIKYTDESAENYDYMGGTSMAAPHVAGLAALIWGYKPELSYSEIRDVILETGDDLDFLDGKTTTGKRINAFNALNSLSEAPIITLTGSSTVNFYIGDTYTDTGATAEDDVDGNITDNIITSGLPIDTTATGTHIITYNISDSAGNLADEVIRTVIVNEVLLESIEITNQATKLIYTIGEELDITDLEVTRFYNNGTEQIEIITVGNITGFNSSATATNQILTITINEKTTTYTIDIIPVPDITPPTIAETVPIPTPTNDNTPEYTFNSIEAGTITYNGLCVSDNTAAIVGDNTIIFNELADGIYNDCYITVTDISDNISNVLAISDFTIDTTAPMVIITSPEDGLITNQSTTTIEYTIDGIVYSDDEILVEGENIVIRSGTDEVGNIGSSSIIIILDTTPPTGYTVDIDQDYINNNDQNKLSFTFTDAETGATYDYSIEHINGSPVPVVGNGIVNGETDQITDIDVSTLNDGELVLFVYLTDIIGNQGHEMMNSVVKDTTAPVVIITSPEDGLITNQSTATIEYTIDGTVYSDDEVLVEGENIIIKESMDKAGNVGSSLIAIILDTTPPTRVNGSPTNALSAGTVEATLSLTTTENAVCRLEPDIGIYDVILI